MASRVNCIKVSGSVAFGPKIITDGLVVHLDAANYVSYGGSGTLWKDISSNANNATITGTTTFLTAKAGGINFPSTTNSSPAFSIPNPTITTESFAIDVWITQQLPISSSTDYIRGVISCSDLWNAPSPGLFPGWAIGYAVTSPAESSSFNAGGRFYSGSANEYSVTPRIGSGNTKIVLGRTYNLVLQRNTIDQKLYFYINGVLDSSTTLGNQYNMSGSQATIGSRVWQAGGITAPTAPKATFHNIKIYKDKNFTDSERLQNYNALKYRFGL